LKLLCLGHAPWDDWASFLRGPWRTDRCWCVGGRIGDVDLARELSQASAAYRAALLRCDLVHVEVLIQPLCYA
jgi:hypothetical protein